jgi:hypothetical protein
MTLARWPNEGSREKIAGFPPGAELGLSFRTRLDGLNQNSQGDDHGGSVDNLHRFAHTVHVLQHLQVERQDKLSFGSGILKIRTGLERLLVFIVFKRNKCILTWKFRRKIGVGLSVAPLFRIIAQPSRGFNPLSRSLSLRKKHPTNL